MLPRWRYYLNNWRFQNDFLHPFWRQNNKILFISGTLIIVCFTLGLRTSTALALPGATLSDGHFTDHGNGTIEDTHTGLFWTKKDSYADLGKCLNWKESMTYISQLDTGGYTDWRLPTIKELETLVEKSQSNVMAYDHNSDYPLPLDSIFSDGAAYLFWSSETSEKVHLITKETIPYAELLVFSDGGL